MKKWTEIRVECYAGYRGDETPRGLRFKDRTVRASKILTQWREPEYRYFRIKGEDQAIYTLRQDVHSGRWEGIPEMPSGAEPRARK